MSLLEGLSSQQRGRRHLAGTMGVHPFQHEGTSLPTGAEGAVDPDAPGIPEQGCVGRPGLQSPGSWGKGLYCGPSCLGRVLFFCC